jgi:hypothetical protein
VYVDVPWLDQMCKSEDNTDNDADTTDNHVGDAQEAVLATDLNTISAIQAQICSICAMACMIRQLTIVRVLIRIDLVPSYSCAGK